MIYCNGYRLLNLRGIYLLLFGRKGAFREVILPIFFGISIGLLIGQFWTVEKDSAISQHILAVNHDEAAAPLPSTFFLRCVVIVHPQAKKPLSFISAVRDTYGKDCNQTVYYTNSKDVQKKVTDQRVLYIESRSNYFHWQYFQQVMEHSAEPPVPWTIIVDEQNYLEVENLRRTLSRMNHNKPLILGRTVRTRSLFSYIFPFLSTERLAIQAGIVLSNTALEKLKKCRGHFFPRASESGIYKCAMKHGIELVDPVDEEGMHLFHFKDLKTLIPQSNGVRDGVRIKEAEATASCCSDHAISFGQLSYKEIRMARFASRDWRVFGRAGTEMVNSSYAIDPSKLIYPPRNETILKKKKATKKENSKKNVKSNLLGGTMHPEQKKSVETAEKSKKA